MTWIGNLWWNRRKSKKKGNNSDITPNKQDNEGAVRDPPIDIPDENAIVEYDETDKDGGHNDNIHVETPHGYRR